MPEPTQKETRKEKCPYFYYYYVPKSIDNNNKIKKIIN